MRFLLTLMLLLLAPASFACSCAGWPTDPDKAVKESYEWYPVIFLGTAETVKMLPGEGEIQETVFSVQKVWKGEIGSSITTTINVMCCICGYQFEKNITYLVFAAKRDDGSYGTSICSLTRPEGRALDYIEALDRISESNF